MHMLGSKMQFRKHGSHDSYGFLFVCLFVCLFSLQINLFVFVGLGSWQDVSSE